MPLLIALACVAAFLTLACVGVAIAHRRGALNRTPRPPLWLTPPSLMSSTPLFSSAAMSFINESTLPRMTPSLASMRWMVGTERPDRSASRR